MSFVAVAIVGAGALGAGAAIYSSNKQSQAAGQAAQTIQSTTNQAVGAQQGFVNQGIDAITGFANKGVNSIQSLLAPYMGAGTSALPTLLSLLTPGANQTDTLSQLPGFQFAQDWGMKGVNNAASVSGLGGNVLAAGSKFSTGLAQQGFGSLVGMLQSLVGTGAGAAQSGAAGIGSLLGSAGQGIGSLLGSAGSNISSLISGAGQNIAGTQIGAANAQAAGVTGAANSLSGALGSYGNMQFLKNLLGGGAGGDMYGGYTNNMGFASPTQRS